MAVRTLTTLLALLLAGGAFCGLGPEPAGVNAFGVLLLFGAWVAWYGWESIQEGYSYQRENAAANRNGADLMAVRLGPVLHFLRGLRRPR